MTNQTRRVAKVWRKKGRSSLNLLSNPQPLAKNATKRLMISSLRRSLSFTRCITSSRLILLKVQSLDQELIDHRLYLTKSLLTRNRLRIFSVVKNKLKTNKIQLLIKKKNKSQRKRNSRLKSSH